MRIVYPYNEILPTGKAHDVYLFNNCASLSTYFDVTLLIGKGSPADRELFSHYMADETSLDIRRLPILRGARFPKINANWVFHHASQRIIRREKPDVVITSVRKQGMYHMRNKVPGVSYVYEVHQLEWYPETDNRTERFFEEREMLESADLVVTTTEGLKAILQESPYNITSPIEVVPLATRVQTLPPKRRGERIRCAYVGQLYPMQGVDLLIKAAQDFDLSIIGGSDADVARLRQNAGPNVTFHGFQPPGKISELLEDIDLFLMPSRNLLAKPHVAHTKLTEYANFGRPIVAPDLPAVKEQMGSLKGVTTYRAEDAKSLAEAVKHCDVTELADTFSWEQRADRYRQLLTSQPPPRAL